MSINQSIHCAGFPCTDVRHDCFSLPQIKVKPADVSVVLVSETAPVNPADSYFAEGDSLFQRTTLQAFGDAGVHVKTVNELLDMGIYLTTAVKCAKTSYGIETSTIKQCSVLLEQELAQFPNVRVYLLMGDVAIKALNEIARRTGETRVIPTGATYKIRGQIYTWHGARVLPSYLQAGPSFFIEKSKRRMIAEDITTAMQLID